MENKDKVIHKSPWPEWFATKDGRSVWICDKASEEKVQVQPPLSWGKNWAWNIIEDGTGIIFRRLA